MIGESLLGPKTSEQPINAVYVKPSKYIAFDIGNILVEVDEQKLVSKIYKELYNGGFYKSNCGPMYEKMLKTAGIIWKHVKEIDLGLTTLKDFGLDTNSFNILKTSWNNIIRPNQEMIDFKNELLNNQTRIALLSNIGYDHLKLLREKYPEVIENCSGHFSCEVGARKPSRLFFQSFLLDYPKFKGCLYVDDRDENLEMATQYEFIPYKMNLSENPDLEKIKSQIKITLQTLEKK